MTDLPAPGHAPRFSPLHAADALRGTDLVVHYPARTGPPVRAVDGVDLTVARGETLGLVGESGCGKSTVAKAVVGLQRPTRGSVLVNGTEVAGADRRTLRAVRAQVQMASRAARYCGSGSRHFWPR